MLVFTLVSCHRDDPPLPEVPSVGPPPTIPTSPTLPTQPPPPPPPTTTADCARAPDYADWPGGRTLALHVPEELVIGDVVTLGADGAAPGQRIVFEVGGICGLDCPPALDGACYQPVSPVVLGEAVADNQGHATVSVTVADWVPQNWFVVQASAPDERALSQVVVDRLFEGLPYLEWYVLGPGIYRNLGGSPFTWFVAPGRRATYDLDPTAEMYGYTDKVSDGVVSPARFLHGTVDAAHATSFEFYTYAYWGGPYTLVAELEPLLTPIPWYPDGDGDGYGDLSGATVASTTPVAGHSADPGDCDDGDAEVHPWADDSCDDGLDTDCDGVDRPCAFTGVADWTPGTSGSRYRGQHWSIAGVNLDVGDVDGDGVIDLFAGGAPGFVRPVDGSDHDTGGYTVYLYSNDDPVVADVDGDGFDDLVSFDDLWGVTVRAGSTQGPTVPATLVPPAYPVFVELAVGDLTGDARTDLTLRSSEGITLMAGPLWDPVAQVDVEDTTEDIQVGDANGDGVDDLWTTEACTYHAPLPAVGASSGGCIDGTWHHGHLALGDADGDGTLDGILYDDGRTNVFLGPWPEMGDVSNAFASIDALTAPEVAVVDGVVPAIAIQDFTAVGTGGTTWVGPVRGGAVDLDEGRYVRIATNGSRLLAEDLDDNGYDELVVSDFLVPVADRGSSGEVWILWDAARDL